MEKKFSLDVDAPHKIIAPIRAAAHRFYEDAGELEASWQDRHAGRPWTMIAKHLDRAADAIQRDLEKMGY